MRWSQLMVTVRVPGLLRILFKQTCLQINTICLKYTLMDLMLAIFKKARTFSKVIFFSPHIKGKKHKNTSTKAFKVKTFSHWSDRTIKKRISK